MLKPGDASMASPFTAKADSVAPCADILRQGRCTLVTTVQMFKILGLLCLSTAYSLSVMYLQARAKQRSACGTAAGRGRCGAALLGAAPSFLCLARSALMTDLKTLPLKPSQKPSTAAP